MKGPYIVKRMFSYQPEGPMFYIWHTDAKKKKFPVASESAKYYVDTDGALYLKSEYEPCDPPAPEREWVDVTKDLSLSPDGSNAVHRGCEVLVAHTSSRFIRRHLRFVDVVDVDDFPFPANCLNLPIRRRLVLEEERVIPS